MSPLFCNGNSVYGSLLTWLSSQYVHFLVLFTWNLFHINYGQLTHEKILICLIFPHFSAIFAQITIFWNACRPCQQYPNIVNKSLYHVYSFVPLFPHFHSTLHCPPHSCQTPVILAESSGIQCSPAEWNWIPVNSTGLQTEIEIKLESGSKYMGTNSCKHKYSIYTDFCRVSVITCNLSVINTDRGCTFLFWANFPMI